MGRGKKKGQKGGDGGDKAEEVPSVSTLSISEETPSTSQAVEEEDGLGLGSRKKNKKQRQLELKAAAEAARGDAQPSLPERSKEPEPKPEIKPEPEVKKEEPKKQEEESDGGLGLGGGGGKKRPRKKKSLAAAEAETKTQGPTDSGLPSVPEQTGPKPAQPGPKSALAPQAGWAQQGPSPGLGQSTSAMGPGPQSSAGPWAGRAPAQPGQGRGAPPSGPGYSQGGPPQGYPSQPAQPAQPTRAPTASSTQVARPTLSRGDLSCRYKIPDKILGRNVRHIPTNVITNYLPMVFKPIKVYRYDVIIKPDKPKKMLPTAFKMAVKKQYPDNLYIAFDQAKNCYTLVPLKDVPSGGSSRQSITIDIADPNGRNITFEVSFKATGVVDLGKLKQHMESGGSSLNTPCEEIQCIDVILRQGTLESYVKCGRQFFKRPKNPLDLSGGLEMWTGLFQSAIFTSHAFINIDVVHKGFPMHQSMIDAITRSFKLATDRKIEDQRGRDVENFMSFIKGLRVIATLVGPPNDGQTREFICNGLVETPSRLTFTSEKDGKNVVMSVADYFAKVKGYRIRYPNLNCMWVGPSNKNIYYPMELLQVSYGQARNRQLNEFQLSNMVREAAAPPVERKRKIEEAAACMNYSTNAFFKKFGLEIQKDFLQVKAKILTAPNLDCGERNTVQPRRGQWNANRLAKPEALSAWAFYALECDSRASNFETIRNLLMDTGHHLGMTVSEPMLFEFNVKLKDLRNNLFHAVEKGIRFVFIIVGTRGRDFYHKVKQMAERDVGILTQCIKENTASRRINPQTIKNILLKVNSKLMGINQVLDSRSMPECLKGGDVMIVGADVTHPSPDQTSIPSIAAVTASMDSKCFTYNIELSIQTPKKEMIVEFADMMYDHLKLWVGKHRILPRKIYVFRDGVSEGQFAEVMNSELSAVHKAYQRFNTPNKPEVLFLLVQKRHHTRFFTSPRCENVEPGTVVDTHIVHPKELDFYLVSHQAIKGTARPTRYHAVCNDGNIPHDEVEQLTYYLCHLYSRCMRAVSYPTPTYYAHLACFRARSLTYGQVFDNAALELRPQRLRVLDKMLQFSRMFFV